MLKRERCHRNSGYIRSAEKSVPTVKKRHYFVDASKTVGGAAPKSFIRMYEHGRVRRSSRQRWQGHIAKVGHKWYPCESITEHLMTRIGQVLGFQMAQSRLVQMKGQVRFLSEYFLRDNRDELVHGAEIFGSYLDEPEFVKKAEAAGLERDLLTVQAAKDAIKARFPSADHDALFLRLVEMVVFDAIVGNHDRHHLNWGIVRDISGKNEPRFAPIFDTARGLFWNVPDHVVAAKHSNSKEREKYVTTYVNGAKTKFGWDGDSTVSHFDLVSLLKDAYPRVVPSVQAKSSPERLLDIEAMIKKEFGNLMTEARRSLIMECLSCRLHTVAESLK